MAFDKGHPEVWAPQLLDQLRARGAGGLDADGKTLAGWLWQSFQPERLVTANSSFNWDWMLGACALYLDPSRAVFRGLGVAEWWVWLLERQVGLAVEGAPEAPINCLGGTEPLSVIYEGMRLGSALAVRLAALRHPANPLSAQVVDRTGRYVRAVLAALGLSAVPWTDPGYEGNAGYWYNGWTLSPVSERSSAPGLQNDLGPIYTLIVGPLPGGQARLVSKREGWAAALLRSLLSEFPDDQKELAPKAGDAPVPADLAGVKLWAEQRWARFAEGTLTYKTRRQNHLSPAILYSWADEGTRRMALGYPYPPGRHRGKHASQSDGSCAVAVDAEGDVAVTAEMDGLTASQPLPSSPPSLYVAGDGQGFRQLNDWP